LGQVLLHGANLGKPNQRYALLFRDYLASHPPVAAAYGELKRRLAAALAKDESYPTVKDPAVDLIYLAAEQWASTSGWTPTQPGGECDDPEQRHAVAEMEIHAPR
jgi:hypothetical protein